MGYNCYLSKMKNEDVIKLRAMSKDEIIKKYNSYWDPNEPDEEYYVPGPYKFGERLYDLGSYPNYEQDIIEKFGKKIFNQPELDDYYSGGYEFSEIGECGLKYIIDYYSEQNANFYEGLIETTTIIGSSDTKLDTFLKSRFGSWKNNQVVKLDGTPHKVTNDWNYEYAIFNLVALYKTFNWSEDTLILYGY